VFDRPRLDQNPDLTKSSPPQRVTSGSEFWQFVWTILAFVGTIATLLWLCAAITALAAVVN
jgi:hypothetical protein